MMKGKGLKHERETVIRFDEETQTASVWTASELTYRRLIKLGYMPSQDNERSAVFEMPKRDVKLPRPKKTRLMTEDQKRQASQRMAHVRSRHSFVPAPVKLTGANDAK